MEMIKFYYSKSKVISMSIITLPLILIKGLKVMTKFLASFPFDVTKLGTYCPCLRMYCIVRFDSFQYNITLQIRKM